jgi:hypothetical protein
VKPVEIVTGEMRLAAEKTLARIARLGEREGVTFVLENLNTAVDDPGTPFAKAADCLALVGAVDSTATTAPSGWKRSRRVTANLPSSGSATPSASSHADDKERKAPRLAAQRRRDRRASCPTCPAGKTSWRFLSAGSTRWRGRYASGPAHNERGAARTAAFIITRATFDSRRGTLRRRG